MLRLYRIISILFVAMLVGFSAQAADSFRKEYEKLAKVMEDASVYKENAIATVDSVRRIYKATPVNQKEKKLRVGMQLAQLEANINPNNAIAIAREAVKNADGLGENAEIEAQLTLFKVLGSSGMYNTSIKLYQQLCEMPLSEEQKLDMWEYAKKMYAQMMRTLPDDNFYADQYREENYSLSDSLLTVLPRGNALHRYLWAENMYQAHRFADAREIIEKLKPDVVEGTALYSRVWYMDALICKETNNEVGYATSLCKASINDIKMWDLYQPALPALIQYLSNDDKTKEAYELLSFYLANANPAKSHAMPYALAMTLPSLESAYSGKLKASYTRLWILSGVIILSLIISIGLLIRFYSDRKRLRKMTGELEEQAHLQGSYMGNFIELCTIYAERLEELRLMAIRKIQAGQTEDLLRGLKNSKLTAPKMHELYTVFDNVFLELYPDFIDKINQLLEPVERYDIHKGDELPPELRIYALIIMGITDGKKISFILHYTTNTIYSYRNKLRNKSRSREAFDDEVMKLFKKKREKIDKNASE